MIINSVKEDWKILFTLAVYTFLLLFFCSQMSPLYPSNDWSDANLYFNIGKGLFNGKTIYSDLFDHKGPLIFVIYGIGYLFSNDSFLGMYFIQSLFWIAMVITAYYIARLYFEKVYAFVIAVLFPAFIQTHTSVGGSAEEFITVFIIISFYLFLLYFKSTGDIKHKPIWMLVHGIMFAATLFIKINLVVFWVFPFLAILIRLIKCKEYKNILQNGLAFLIGILVITIPFIIYFAANNSLVEAWNIYIVLNKNYANLGSIPEVAELLFFRFYQRLRFEPFDSLIILAGGLLFPFKFIECKIWRIAFIATFFSLFAIVFVTPAFQFYYTIPYYLFGLFGICCICRYIIIKNTWSVYVVCTALALFWDISKKNFFGYEIKELIDGKEKKTVTTHFMDIIGKENNPTLMNLGLDENIVIFTRLNIMPNIKYFVTPNITYDIYPDMRNAQTEYIKNKEVQFIMLPEGAFNFDYFIDLDILKENYNLEDVYINSTDKRYYLYKRKD